MATTPVTRPIVFKRSSLSRKNSAAAKQVMIRLPAETSGKTRLTSMRDTNSITSRLTVALNTPQIAPNQEARGKEFFALLRVTAEPTAATNTTIAMPAIMNSDLYAPSDSL